MDPRVREAREQHCHMGLFARHAVTYPTWLLDRYARDEYEFLPDPGKESA